MTELHPHKDSPSLKLSVIIVNYNGWSMLAQCLPSVQSELAALNGEIWIVDNGSTDNSLQRVAEKFPDVRCIRNEQNRGFAAANNQAIVKAGGEFVLLLNNDTVAKPGSITTLLEAMSSDKRLAAVGPKLIKQDGTTQPSCMHFPSLAHTVSSFVTAKFGGDTRYIASGNQPILRVDAVSGACLLMRRRAIEDVGVLDEGYFMYAEETDWCYRASQKGWQIGYVPAAHVIHFGSQTASREPERFYVERRYSNVRFFLRHYGRVPARLNAVLLRANMRLRWLMNRSDRARMGAIIREFDGRISQLFAEGDGHAPPQ